MLYDMIAEESMPSLFPDAYSLGLGMNRTSAWSLHILVLML